MKMTGSAKVQVPSHRFTLEVTQAERDYLVKTFNEWEPKYRRGGDYVPAFYISKNEILADLYKEILLGLV